MVASPEGPFVGLAVLCHSFEPRPDGSADVRGLVHGVAVEPADEHEATDDPLGLRPDAVVELLALIFVHAGSERGPHTLTLQGVYPNGRPGTSVARAIEFTSRTPAATCPIPIELSVFEPGVYHYDVLYDGRLLTRIPLVVQYVR